MGGYKIYLCGSDYANLDRRSECPSTLHDWPLPNGYVDAGEVASARLRHRWSNKRCPECSLYGWIPGTKHESTNPVHVTMKAVS